MLLCNASSTSAGSPWKKLAEEQGCNPGHTDMVHLLVALLKHILDPLSEERLAAILAVRGKRPPGSELIEAIPAEVMEDVLGESATKDVQESSPSSSSSSSQYTPGPARRQDSPNTASRNGSWFEWFATCALAFKGTDTELNIRYWVPLNMRIGSMAPTSEY